MIRINLLPPEILRKRKSEKLIGYVAAAGVALTVLLLAVYGVGFFLVASANSELQGKKDQAANLQKAAEAFAIFESKEADLIVRRDVVEAALSGRVDWARLFTELSLVLPSDQWVSAILASEDAEPSLTLTGVALDPDETPDSGHKSIAASLIRLADLDQLANAWLGSSEKDASAYDPYAVITFDLTADLAKDQPEASAAGAAPAPPAQP